MTRILLFVVVMAAVAAVLWSSWRLDRRLFAGVLALLFVVLALFAGGYFQSSEKAWTAMPVEQVELEVVRWNATESGIRIEGRIHNSGRRPVGLIYGRARLLDCPQEGNCRELASAELELRQHVPADTTYPFDTILRIENPPRPDNPRWLLEVERAEGYTEKAPVSR